METNIEAAEAATQHEPGPDPTGPRHGHVPTEYDSHDPASMDAALSEIYRRRAERLPRGVSDAVDTINAGAAPPEPADVTKIQYLNPDDSKTPTTARAAADSYNEYKQRLAAEFLQGVIAEEQQAQAAEQPAAVEQPTEPTPQELAELEQTVQRQQREAELQNLAQARQSYDIGLNTILAELNNVGLQQFSDIKSEADLIRLAQTNPQRFAALQQHGARVQALQGEISQIQQQQRALYQEQFKAYADQQEKVAERLIPELTDPQTCRDLQIAARDTLKAANFTEQELRAGWDGGAQFSLRDARVQKIIASAAKWERSQARAHDLNSHRRPPPPVQRPGTAGAVRSNSANDIERLSSRLAKSGSVNDAYALVLAKRAAREG